MSSARTHKILATVIAVPVVAWVVGLATSSTVIVALVALVAPCLIGLGLVARKLFQRGQGRAAPDPMVSIIGVCLLVAWICAFIGGRVGAKTGEPQLLLIGEALAIALITGLLRLRRSS